MGLIEIEIAASSENSAVVASLAETPEVAARAVETPSQADATEALAEC